MTNKQLAMEAIRDLPDDASLDEIIDHIETMADIQAGIEDIEAGRYITQEELERQIAKWVKR